MAAGKSNPFHLANLALAQFLPEMECFLNPGLFGLLITLIRINKHLLNNRRSGCNEKRKSSH